MTHAQRSSSLAPVQRQVDVVLEQPRHAVVGEPLTQLDYGDQPGGDGQVLSDMTQSGFFVVVRFFAVGGVGESFFGGFEGGLLFFGDGLGSVLLAKFTTHRAMTYWTGSTSD